MVMKRIWSNFKCVCERCFGKRKNRWIAIFDRLVYYAIVLIFIFSLPVNIQDLIRLKFGCGNSAARGISYVFAIILLTIEQVLTYLLDKHYQ